MAILREVLGTCELKSALSMLPHGGGLVLHHGPNLAKDDFSAK
jgi:hypothetical protein